MKTCWHYDLMYTGGIEQSLASLLELFNNPNMYVAHRKQYLTNEAICKRIEKTSKLIDTNEIIEINPDIWILSGVIFDYADIFKRSMLEDQRKYNNLVIKVAILLSIPVVPTLDEVIEKYGGIRFKPDIQRMAEKYKVGIVCSFS